jgi:hypothetical protein
MAKQTKKVKDAVIRATDAAKEVIVAADKEQAMVTEVKKYQDYDANISQDDLILPRTELLQALSPTVVSGDAKPGEIVNNISKDVYAKPVIVPLVVTKNWIRWRSREEGGGMVWRSNDPTDPKVIEESKWGADGTKPLCTAYLNFLCIIEGDDMPIIVSFSNTSYNAGKKLLTLCKMSPTGSLAASRYELLANSRTNNMGTFFVYDVKKIGPSTSEQQAKASELGTMFGGKDLSSSEQDNKPSTEVGDEF